MKVLVTGGSGFLGSHIVDRLLARGDEVLVIDNFATGRRDNLEPRSGLRIVEGSIADPELVARAFEEFMPQTVVHAAASYKNPNAWIEDTATNITGTINVARSAESVGVKRLIYFQTALCYGLKPAENPIRMGLGLDPSASSYAITKTAGEHFLFLSSLEVLSFRLANAYGPRNMSGPLPTFFHRLSNGKACFAVKTRRDFIFVDDLVEVVVRAIDGRGSKGSYHISSGSDVSIEDLYNLAVQALRLDPAPACEIRDAGADDAASILLDPSKMEAEFGYKIRTPLATGVARAIEYYQKYGIQETYTHLKLEGDKK
jgi:UDP-glucose 4-epimerase